jgi:TetR/AcrR family transcriptional regulator, cholesterol catabolism regulator
LQLFEEQGFHATSVQEIAVNAGVSKGAFYHHFEKKEDVLRLIHDEFQDAQLADTERIIEEFDTPVEQLREIVRASIASTTRFRSHVAVFFQERRFITGKDFAAVKKKRDLTEQKLLSIVEAGIASGELRPDVDPRVFVFSLIGMIAYTNQWFRADGRLSIEAVGDMIADLILDGIVADRSRGKAAKRGRRSTS